MKNTIEREEKLLEMIKLKKKLSVKEIAESLKISEPTARRLCSHLYQKGKVMRTHGGITCLPNNELEYSFEALEYAYIEEKKHIGDYASTIIKDNEIIFLEAGTTVQQLATAIAERIKSGSLSNILVFTNSIINLNILSPYCNVNVIGGLYRPKRKDFSGYISEKMVRGLHFTSCFIGSDGIDIDEGIMATDIDTARIDELLITRSEKSYILADSSKFSRKSLISYASINEISMIITDNNLSANIKETFDKKNVKIVCV